MALFIGDIKENFGKAVVFVDSNAQFGGGCVDDDLFFHGSALKGVTCRWGAVVQEIWEEETCAETGVSIFGQVGIQRETPLKTTMFCCIRARVGRRCSRDSLDAGFRTYVSFQNGASAPIRQRGLRLRQGDRSSLAACGQPKTRGAAVASGKRSSVEVAPLRAAAYHREYCSSVASVACKKKNEAKLIRITLHLY